MTRDGATRGSGAFRATGLVVSASRLRVVSVIGDEGIGMSERDNQRIMAAFIWSVADLLRGVYKQSEYGRVILPLTVLRRLDCVLEPTKDNVLAIVGKLPASLENRAPVLAHAAGQSFYNTSKHTFTTLLADPGQRGRQLAQLHCGVLRVGP